MKLNQPYLLQDESITPLIIVQLHIIEFVSHGPCNQVFSPFVTEERWEGKKDLTLQGAAKCVLINRLFILTELSRGRSMHLSRAGPVICYSHMMQKRHILNHSSTVDYVKTK